MVELGSVLSVMDHFKLGSNEVHLHIVAQIKKKKKNTDQTGSKGHSRVFANQEATPAFHHTLNRKLTSRREQHDTRSTLQTLGIFAQ